MIFALSNVAWGTANLIGSGGGGALASGTQDLFVYALGAGLCLLALCFNSLARSRNSGRATTPEAR